MGSGENITASKDDVLAGYITMDELSEQTGWSKRTIQRRHAMREGPPRVKVGRLILYNTNAVRIWLESNTEAMPDKCQPSLDIKKALMSKKRLLTKMPLK